MKILLIMDPGLIVPPSGYGGIERLVEIFATEYQRQGHDIHLLVGKGSQVPNCAVYTFGRVGFPPKKWSEWLAMFQAWLFLFKNRRKFDLIHNFGRLAYLIPVLNIPVLKIMTYQREINGNNISFINNLPNKNLIFTGCSSDLISRIEVSGNWHTVYNSIRFGQYSLQSDVNQMAPLIFLGRIERIKGCHTAIKVAKKTNNKLIIAGNISTLVEEKKYFHDEIEPYIDNEQIIYVGEVDDIQKNEYLGISKALLMPIEWNEPFGIVMIEAMACGTPVIAFPFGSVPEVVQEGITGFVVSDEEQMIEAVNGIMLINRSLCRITAQNRFDVSVISKKYLSLASVNV